MDSLMSFWSGSATPAGHTNSTNSATADDLFMAGLLEETYGDHQENDNENGHVINNHVLQETNNADADNDNSDQFLQTTPTITVKPEDSLRDYQQAKHVLANMDFGLSPNNVYIPSSNVSAGDLWDYIATQPVVYPEDPEVSSTPLPLEYQRIFNTPSDHFPFQLKIEDLPNFSRVETQIKINLQIKPAPKQFLIHLPRDTIAKPKFTLSSAIKDEDMHHMLFLDTFAINSDSTPGSVKSCNACQRCMKRELKRASRKKKGLDDDSSNWDLKIPKRAIIFNAKEVLSLPAPVGLQDDLQMANLELLSRIVCYCRHHQQSNGFKLLFILKNSQGKIVGKCLSDPIMIMDRKKPIKTIDSVAQISNKGNTSETNHLEGGLYSGNDSSSLRLLDDHSDFSDVSNFVANNSENALNMLLNQSIMGNSEDRPNKRLKRTWSPPSPMVVTTNNNNNANTPHRNSSINTNNTMDPSFLSIKREAVSPLTSDTNSPHYHHNNIMSSATSNSIVGLTPEKAVNLPTSTSSMMMNNDIPMIQRIIPAQGPIRGGIEVTLLGTNFHQGLQVKFGTNVSMATQCWSETTMVTYLPPASIAGPVLVTLDSSAESPNGSSGMDGVGINGSGQIFTYTDDTDRQLIELALQIVGLKMNGKLEDAKNIAKRIVGTNGDMSPNNSQGVSPNNSNIQVSGGYDAAATIDWMAMASTQMEELSQTTLNHEEILLKFLNIVNLPNSPISSPNWGVSNNEGQSILHLASFMNYDKLCYYLIKQGAKVDMLDKNGFMPLHLAFLKGNRGIIKLLFKYMNGSLGNVKFDQLYQIADSNVLDLLVEQERMVRRGSIESIISDDYDVGHCQQRIRKPRFDFDDPESDTQADDEDDGSADEDDEDETTIINNNNEVGANPFGLNLWVAMKDAIVNKMNELGVSHYQEDAMNWINQAAAAAARNTNLVQLPQAGPDADDEDLPKYDDLFPDTGQALMTFINFRGHKTQEEEQRRQQQQEGQLIVEDLVSDDNDSSTESVIAVKKPIVSDWKLLLFWLPMMITLCLLLLGMHWGYFEFSHQKAQQFIDQVKTQFGVVVLGPDRLGEFVNVNLAYGRHLLSDVNDAMLTAVGR